MHLVMFHYIENILRKIYVLGEGSWVEVPKGLLNPDNMDTIGHVSKDDFSLKYYICNSKDLDLSKM